MTFCHWQGFSSHCISTWASAPNYRVHFEIYDSITLKGLLNEVVLPPQCSSFINSCPSELQSFRFFIVYLFFLIYHNILLHIFSMSNKNFLDCGRLYSGFFCQISPVLFLISLCSLLFVCMCVCFQDEWYHISYHIRVVYKPLFSNHTTWILISPSEDTIEISKIQLLSKNG